MKELRKFCFVYLCVLPALQAVAADTTSVIIPNKQVQFELFKQGTQLAYSVRFKGLNVINNSSIKASVNNAQITGGVQNETYHHEKSILFIAPISNGDHA